MNGATAYDGDWDLTPADRLLIEAKRWCGECGHKLIVQYCNGNRYACTYLQHTQGAPMCQHLPGYPHAGRGTRQHGGDHHARSRMML